MKDTAQIVGIVMAIVTWSVVGLSAQSDTNMVPATSTNTPVLVPTGTNIVMRYADFIAAGFGRKVKKDMTDAQVISALGQPKKVDMEKEIVRWFYTYELPDRSGQFRWMILMVEFRDKKTIGDGLWLPRG